MTSKTLKRLAALLDVPGFLHELEHRQESRLNRMIELFHAKPERAPVATLIVIGTTANSYKRVGPPGLEGTVQNPDWGAAVPEKPFTACWADSKTLSDRASNTDLTVEPMRPLEAATLVVLADLERVSVNGLFVGVDCVVLGSPVGFYSQVITPGVKVRAMVSRREPSGK